MDQTIYEICRKIYISILYLIYLHLLRQKQRNFLYLCDLDTPVEQPLWAQFVLVVPDVLQQGAVTVELGDQLQAVSRTDPQDPDNVHVVQASQRYHVLPR